MKVPEPTPPNILILGKQLVIASDIYIQLLNMGYPVIGIQQSMAGILKSIENILPDIVIVELGHDEILRSIEEAQFLMEYHHIPVIILSANVSHFTYRLLERINPYAIITMPFDATSLEKGIYLTKTRMNFEANQL